MPTIHQHQAIREYWETVKSDYPNMSFKTFEEICITPFSFVKSVIRKAEHTVISIKYFGKFRMFPSKILSNINKIKVDYSREFITLDEHNSLLELRDKQLKEVKNEFKTRD